MSWFDFGGSDILSGLIGQASDLLADLGGSGTNVLGTGGMPAEVPSGGFLGGLGTGIQGALGWMGTHPSEIGQGLGLGADLFKTVTSLSRPTPPRLPQPGPGSPYLNMTPGAPDPQTMAVMRANARTRGFNAPDPSVLSPGAQQGLQNVYNPMYSPWG